MAIYCFY